jgi:hypothetical protein
MNHLLVNGKLTVVFSVIYERIRLKLLVVIACLLLEVPEFVVSFIYLSFDCSFPNLPLVISNFAGWDTCI